MNSEPTRDPARAAWACVHCGGTEGTQAYMGDLFHPECFRETMPAARFGPRANPATQAAALFLDEARALLTECEVAVGLSCYVHGGPPKLNEALAARVRDFLRRSEPGGVVQ